MIARVTRGLADFRHPRYERRLLWDITHFHKLGELLEHVEQSEHPRLAEGVMVEFEERVVPSLGSLRRQVVHGDFSPHNVIASPGNDPFITGVIDFRDAVRTALISDLAVGIANQIGKDPEAPWGRAGDFAAGYARGSPFRRRRRRASCASRVWQGSSSDRWWPNGGRTIPRTGTSTSCRMPTAIGRTWPEQWCVPVPGAKAKSRSFRQLQNLGYQVAITTLAA